MSSGVANFVMITGDMHGYVVLILRNLSVVPKEVEKFKKIVESSK